jgi:Protein of unknown function (DUF2804)
MAFERPWPAFRGTRPLKRWRYVAVLDERVMLCAADVHVGPARQTFWMALDRASGEMSERTHTLLRRGTLELAPGRLRLNDGGVKAELTLSEEPGVEVTCGPVWTRKQAGVRVEGTLALGDGRELRLDALAVIDDTAGYHPRVTDWRWAAGVGWAPDGTPLAFNLVQGVNDPPHGSERAVWIDGVPAETPPVRFAEDLSSIACEDGSVLGFQREGVRARRESLLLIAADYRCELGSFAGTLPGGVSLASGLGIVERHHARW